MKKYNIIYADPPWSYRDKALQGNRGACCKYDVMDTDSIGRLPIKDIADNDCVLFMWVTMPKLNECFELIKQWGFEYKTVAFTWVKVNKKSTKAVKRLSEIYTANKTIVMTDIVDTVDKMLFMGMGRWTRANAEICLLATKGKPKRINAGVHSVIVSPIEQHSKKPDVIRDRIVKLCGDLPKVELFARKATNGWDIWGNEVECDISLIDYGKK
jgi:N6-adenosine-specific RNA methylase IME4